MNNYVIYKSSEGIINTLGGIAYCVDWCILNNHKLLIDMKCNPHYKLNFSKFFYIKDFEFTEDYSEIELDIKDCQPRLEIDKIKKYYVNDKIVLNNLSLYDINDKNKIYCGNGGISRQLINKYIRINKDILNKLEDSKLNFNYQGIHFRNTDIKTDISDILININNKNIYFATDHLKSLEEIKTILPDKNIINFSNLEKTNEIGLHYVKNDKEEMIYDFLKDIYLLYHSSNFIGSYKSSITRLLFYIINNKSKDNIFTK